MSGARLALIFLVAAACRTASPWTRAEVYFGSQCGPGCTAASEADWERFVADQIAPRFPSGFTVFPARGHWQGDAGPQDEQTHVLIVVFPSGDPGAPAKLTELRKLYREAFHQEAVLEIDVPATASF